MIKLLMFINRGLHISEVRLRGLAWLAFTSVPVGGLCLDVARDFNRWASFTTILKAALWSVLCRRSLAPSPPALTAPQISRGCAPSR